MILPKVVIYSVLFLYVGGGAGGGGTNADIPLIRPGHAALKTSTLKFPRAVYYIRVKNQVGKWVTQGLFTEQGRPSKDSGGAVLERQQVQTFNDGKSYLAHTAVFEKSTLKPLATRRRSSLPGYSEGFIKSYDLVYETGTLRGTWLREGGDVEEFPAKELDGAMFEGDVLGVVLAALPLAEGYKAGLPVMFSQMGTPYKVIARVVGRKQFSTDTGGPVTAWAVETDWHDLISGQVSPGGGSGGTYYVVSDPPAGYPHVFKYINDTFDTELIPQMSPRPGELE